MNASPPARLLSWDTAFFGRRIARIEAPQLSADAMQEIAAWARREDVECLYYLANASDEASIRVAEGAGFRFTDERVTLTRPLNDVGLGLPPDVGPHRKVEVPALREIARVSHEDTRFYHDPHFPRERCAALYETWIANACAGAAEAVLVVRSRGESAGYLSCLLEPDGRGAIGLVAVSPDHRGLGLGERLVRASLAWFAEHGCKMASVATQARNTRALTLYERIGFSRLSMERWYHLWPADGARSE